MTEADLAEIEDALPRKVRRGGWEYGTITALLAAVRELLQVKRRSEARAVLVVDGVVVGHSSE